MKSNYDKLLDLGIELKRSTGTVKVKCPMCSHTRKHKTDPCLSVNIDSGLYNCHNCQFKGTVAAPERTEKKFVKPQWLNNTALSDKLVNWFKSRGISQQVLIKMQVSEGMEFMPQEGKQVNTVQFPYMRGAEVVNVKFRTAKKDFKMVKDAELIFYNLNGIQGQKEAIIVEGEPDCLSFIESGIENVVSVPNGASQGSQKLEYLDNCWHEFEDKEKIYIGTDNDKAGIALRNELIRRLGDDRCYIVDYKDCKDGNEYMLKYGKTEMPALLTDAKAVPIEGIFTVEQMSSDIEDLYKNGLPMGETIQQPEFDRHLTWVKGQFTVITGIPNHGKSDFVDHIVSRLAAFRSWKFGVFSPENFPISLHVSKLIEKISGKSFNHGNRISVEELQSVKGFLDKHFFFIRPDDETFTLDNILRLARKLVLKHGINGLIIDPWNTLEYQLTFGQTETTYISRELAKLTSFLQRYNLHGFLVAHPTKVQKDKRTGKYEVPTLYSISGSANFFNKASNGFCVYRDFEEHKTTVYVQKVKFRHLGQVGAVQFKYNLKNGRYCAFDESFDERNYLLPPEEAVEIPIDHSYDNFIRGIDDEVPF